MYVHYKKWSTTKALVTWYPNEIISLANENEKNIGPMRSIGTIFFSFSLANEIISFGYTLYINGIVRFIY